MEIVFLKLMAFSGLRNGWKQIWQSFENQKCDWLEYFQSSAIFAFNHDRGNRRVIEACSIAYHNTTLKRQGFFRRLSKK